MKRSRLLSLALALLCLMLALSGCAKKQEAPTAQDNYQQAIALLQEGQYQQAASAFEQLGHYYDASEYAMYCRALLSAQKGDHAQAAATFLMLGDFLDSPLMAVYHNGRALESAQDYENALPLYKSIFQFTDAAARAEAIPGLILERDYQYALALEKNGQYQDAIQAYRALNGYSDSQKRIAAIYELLNSQAYAKAQALMEKGELSAARDAFLALGNYKDSPEKAKSCAYDMAKKAEENQELEQALALYIQLGDYQDSVACAQVVQNKIWEKAYLTACKLVENDQLVEAYEAFLALESYKDAAQQAQAIREEALYRSAYAYANSGNYQAALENYRLLGDYKDSAEKARLVEVCTMSTKNQRLASGVFGFQLQNAWGFVDLNNNRDVAPVWSSIRSFNSNHLSIISENGLYGLIDLRGQYVLPCVYADIKPGDNGYFTASQKKGNYNYTLSMISPDGVVLFTGYALGDSCNSSLDSRYNSVKLNTLSFASGTVIAQAMDKTWCLLNTKGEAILSGMQEISYCSRLNKQDTLKVKSLGLYWLVSLDGKTLHEQGWLQMDAVGKDLIRVQHPNKLYGYIRNENCQIAIEPQFENARAFAQDYAAVMVNGLWGFIDGQGSQVIAAKYESVADFNGDRCFVIEPQMGVQIIGRQGELIYFKENVYAAAEAMDAQSKYEEAIAAFESLNGYADSTEKALLAREKINTSIYAYAEQLESQGELLEAASVYEWLGEYADSKARAEACRNTYYASTYENATALEAAGKLEEAIAIYLTLGDYNESARHAADLREQINQEICLLASEQTAAAQFEEAIATLSQIPDYANVPELIADLEEKILNRDYQAAEQMEIEGRFADAYNAYMALGNYQDSADRARAVTEKAEEQKRAQKYQAAMDSEANGDLEMAKMLYTELGNYRDCKDKIAQVEEKILRRSYDQAVALLKADDFSEAEKAFQALGSYQDSAALLQEAKTGLQYQAAVEDALNGKLQNAYKTFAALGNYKDSATKAEIVATLTNANKTQKVAKGVLTFQFHGLWGIANLNTNVLTPAKYNSIEYNTKYQYSQLGLLKVYLKNASDARKDAYGYINMNAQEVIPCKFTLVSDFNADGLCTVASNTMESYISGKYTYYRHRYHFGLMNSSGKTVSQPSWRTMGSSKNQDWNRTQSYKAGSSISSWSTSSYCKIATPSFTNGFMIVQTPGGSYGFIDKNGTVIGGTSWKSVTAFSADGLAKVQASNSLYGFINNQGQAVGEIAWNAANNFSYGYAAVKDSNGKWGFIDMNGRLVIPCRYTEVAAFTSIGTCDVKTSDGIWQIIDTNGNTKFFGK